MFCIKTHPQYRGKINILTFKIDGLGEEIFTANHKTIPTCYFRRSFGATAKISAMLILLVLLQPVMTSLIDVMGLYHNYQEVVELVLEFYCEMARRTLCYLVASDSRSGH